MKFDKFLKKIPSKIKKDPLFSLFVVATILIALFFRTYNYSERIYIQADNSRDLQVATYAKDTLQLPQIGQFSSAGPFFYGPWYYWYQTSISFIPLGFLTHWYAMTFIYLVFIYLIYWVGKQIGNKWLGAQAALLAAISPSQINQSFNIWNPAIVPFLTLLTIVFALKYTNTKRQIYIFLLGLTFSLAFTIHFQSMLIAPIVLVTLVLNRLPFKKFLQNLVLLTLSLIIPLLPLLYFDANNNWYNSKSFIIYFLIDQYRIWVPNRYLTYLGSYWPDAWGYIIGGNKYVAIILISSVSVLTLTKLKNFSKNKKLLLLAISFAISILLFRYYRGERFQYYSLFANPYIIILSTWALQEIYKLKKLVGILLISAVIISSLIQAQKDLIARNISYKKIQTIKNEIYLNYPDKNFDIFGCYFNAELISHPLALLTYKDSRNEKGGVKIGTCVDKAGNPTWTEITDEIPQENPFWLNKSTKKVYEETVLWWKEKPPQKSDFLKFLKERLNPSCYPHC